jgi:predicted transcriptional regulator
METIKQNRMRRRKKVVTFEASEAWVEWVDGLAEKVGANRSTTIDQALRRLAMHLRYGSLPPKR